MSIFDEIRNQLDIVEVISEYLPLKRVGNSYSSRCPFHPDSTPSFYVSPSKQIWKCFGCGKGGDVIKFVAEYENISYFDAAKLLAEKYNLNVDFGGEEEGKFYSALRKINLFYKEKLKESKEIRNYLLKVRKLPSFAVEDFEIGFSPKGFEVVDYARREGIFEELLELGHFVKNSRGDYRDFFQARITLPVKNITSKIVAFGGRAAEEGTKPKYKNSPNSEIFQKEKTLYGIDRAKDYTKDRDFLILVEGYFDVIRLHSVGFGNSVAPLGTSLTLHQARAISKLAKKVYLLFDGDTAGRRAAFESAKKLLKFPLQLYLVLLPKGEDPDSFLIKAGVKSFRKLLEEAKPLRVFLIELFKSKGKESYLKLYRELVNSITDPVLKEIWVKSFRDLTGADLFAKKRVSLTKKVDIPKELKPFEVDFLLGLLYLGEKVDLKDFNLSGEARNLAERILKGEREKLPSWLFEVDTLGLERRFELAKDYLSLDLNLLEETFKTLLELERKVKRGKATKAELLRYVKLLGELGEGEKKLYKKFKEKVQTL